MNRFLCVKAALVVIAAVAVFGCKSKQESPAKTQGQPQQQEAVKSISGQGAAGVVASSPKDKSDAEAAASKVLGQMEAGDWASIYDQAAPQFKQIGKKEDFVAKFQATQKKVGALKNPKEASLVTRPDQTVVVVYHMDNDRFNTERRLTFARAKTGEMQLYGLNQHDEPKGGAKK